MGLVQETLALLEPFYNRVILSLVLLLLGLIVGKLVGKLVQKILSEMELGKIIRKTTGITIRIESILGNIIQYLIYFIFIMWGLERLGLGSIILNIVAGGVVLIIIISIVLAIKDFLPNAVAGLYIIFKGVIKTGDRITVDGISGTIEEIDLIETKLSAGKDSIYIPNSTLLKSNIKKEKPKKMDMTKAPPSKKEQKLSKQT